MEQGDEACGGGEPENHEEPVFANETSLPEVELIQRDRGPGGLVDIEGGNLIARSGKNADGSFRRAQRESASNNSNAHHSGCAKQARGRAGICDSLQDRAWLGSTPADKINHIYPGPSSTVAMPDRSGSLSKTWFDGQETTLSMPTTA